MKKYFAIFAVLFTVILSSCSNDDIEVINTSSFKLNISTQPVYDEFEIAEDFKELCLGGKGYSIGVYSYIYDKEGNLAASDSTYNETFGKVTHNFDNLKVGEYTLVILEMLVENDNDYSSSCWLIAGQENLETIQIHYKEYISYWNNAVGLYTGTVNVTKGNMQVDIVPKGIGCIINSEMLNFNKSDYEVLFFCTKDQPSGRLLSPKIKGADRFVYDRYNDRNTVEARGITWNDDLSLNYYEFIPSYLLEEGMIKCGYGASTLDKDGFINNFEMYPSENYTFNVVDGQIYWGTDVYVGGKQECEARLFDSYEESNLWFSNIRHEYSKYVKPYLNWGSTAYAVNNMMKNSDMILTGAYSNDEYGYFRSTYVNAFSTIYFYYYFDVDQTDLYSVNMYYHPDYYSVESILSDLKKTYEGGVYDPEIDGYILWSNDTGIILYNDTSDGWISGKCFPYQSYKLGVEQIKRKCASQKSDLPMIDIHKKMDLSQSLKKQTREIKFATHK